MILLLLEVTKDLEYQWLFLVLKFSKANCQYLDLRLFLFLGLFLEILDNLLEDLTERYQTLSGLDNLPEV